MSSQIDHEKYRGLFRKQILQTFVWAFLLTLGIDFVITLGSIMPNNIKDHGIPFGIYRISASFRLTWRGATVFLWLYSLQKETN